MTNRKTSSRRETIIKTKDLTIGYHDRPIASKVTIDIQEGEFIGIFGPNGSGKTTFLRTLLGLLKPLNGQITILNSSPKLGNSAIGYMPQIRSHVSIANLTGRALLEAVYNGSGYGLPILSRSKKITIDSVIERVGASSYADRPFSQLSGGERQRVYLAQALLGSPKLLLLDEPLSNLDPKYQDVFIDLLSGVQKEFNMTILFTAHDPNPLLHVMNRILFFANGKSAIGPINELITSKALSNIYGTPIEVMRCKDKIFVFSEGQHNMLGEGHHHD